MAKLRHKNLFLQGDKTEVYAAFQRDYDRASWSHLFWHFVLFVSALVTTSVSGDSYWLWVFLGIYAAARALERFIDMSNRNWAMHVIDWIEHDRNHDKTP